MGDSFLSLIPPIIAIFLVISTKRVLTSLGIGVLSAAFLVSDYAPIETIKRTASAFGEIFWADGAVNTSYVFILIFVISLGVIAALILMSGGSAAFSDWAVQRIRTRRGAQMLAACLGVIIFIDDYFNALAVGQVSRPVTDRRRVARAKLAYVIDSTSAPVAVLAPFSSWGASIIGIMTPIVAASALEVSDVEAFLGAAASNYYAIAAVVTVFIVVWFQIDFGAMRSEEERAVNEGETYDSSQEIPGELAEDLPVHQPGAKRALVIPFLALVVGVVGGIVWTGWRNGGSLSVLDVMANTDVTQALMYGAGLGLAASLYYYVRYTATNPRFSLGTFGKGVMQGARSMLPAVYILLLAWMLGSLINELGTGEYLGSLVESSNLPPEWLIPVIFLVAAVMAFSTGTSWGSFGILLPIAGDIMNSVGETELLLPALGAVLAGAVFGDHCSPISDTTILSSTGASCNVITHVITQLPYAMFSAFAALTGYVVYALTANTLIGLVGVLVVLALGTVIGMRVFPKISDSEPQHDEQPSANLT